MSKVFFGISDGRSRRRWCVCTMVFHKKNKGNMTTTLAMDEKKRFVELDASIRAAAWFIMVGCKKFFAWTFFPAHWFCHSLQIPKSFSPALHNSLSV